MKKIILLTFITLFVVVGCTLGEQDTVRLETEVRDFTLPLYG